MKISDLFEQDDPSFPAMGQPTTTVTKTSVPLSVDKNKKKLGTISSHNALIRQHPSQQEIIKRQRIPGEDELDYPSELWRNAVIAYNKKNPMGNPWLPQYTEIRIKTDPSGKTRTQTTEMRYQHGWELSPEAIMSFATRIFPNFEQFIESNANFYINLAKSSGNQRKIKQAEQDYKKRFTSNSLWETFIELVVEVYDEPTRNRKLEHYTPDGNLTNALSLVRRIIQSPKYEGSVRLDMTTENIMIRNTGVGWQPVITDPIASG